jgi:hypothetical protein
MVYRAMFRKIRFIVLAVSLAMCMHASAWAQTSAFDELQVAYIFNFAKYVKWPKEGSAIVIGIYGEVKNIDYWTQLLSEKKVRNKPLQLKQIETLTNLDDINIIYVPESGSEDFKLLAAATAGKSILLVTEEDLIKRGAAISFVVEDDRLKFKLKQSALADIGLTATEGLLKLAILK